MLWAGLRRRCRCWGSGGRQGGELEGCCRGGWSCAEARAVRPAPSRAAGQTDGCSAGWPLSLWQGSRQWPGAHPQSQHGCLCGVPCWRHPPLHLRTTKAWRAALCHAHDTSHAGRSPPGMGWPGGLGRRSSGVGWALAARQRGGRASRRPPRCTSAAALLRGRPSAAGSSHLLKIQNPGWRCKHASDMVGGRRRIVSGP